MLADLLRRHAPTLKQVLWGVLGAFVALVVLVVIGYLTTSIPNPNSIATQQATYYLYSNGKALAHDANANRTDVSLDRVPLFVQHAVLAAEDRSFESEPGISPTGIVRALLTDLRGGDIQQGGSTITQQYVKNAYLSQQRTFTRKIREIFIAVKLAQEKPKSEILQDYLNTIYFGRNAYGIQAASEAYFHRDVTKLNVAQGALLAAVIRAPSYYEPTKNRNAAMARWQYVINGMVSQHWLSSSDAAQLKFPGVYPLSGVGNGDCVGPTGFICQAVQAELQRHGFSPDRLAAGGYRVYTTIDQTAQAAAVKAETDNNGGYITSGIDKGRESALVSVQPGDGAIRAMYGGDHYCSQAHQHPDSCTDLTGVGSNFIRSPGSSFKPYTVIAALEQGIGLNSVFDGPPHIDFPGTQGKGISNSQNESCPHCTLTEALAKSINTIFVPLAQKVGPDKIAKVAEDAGIPSNDIPSSALVPTITLGVAHVSPLDQAVAYATIAAQGIEADPYIVSKVVTADGRVVYQSQVKKHRVFPADVMADTTYAMTRVLAPGGTAAGRGLSGRPAAGKTGTNGGVTGNFDAWFVGFTPQLATAVWFGNHDQHHQVTSNGQPIYGAQQPAMTWQEMMNAALAGKPVETFPPAANVGQSTTASPSSSPSSSPTPSNSISASVPPSPSPSLTLLPPPHRSQSPSPTSSPSQSPTTQSSPKASPT